MSDPTMPAAPDICQVERRVLRALLRDAALVAIALKKDANRSVHLVLLGDGVDSGERDTLTAADWEGGEST